MFRKYLRYDTTDVTMKNDVNATVLSINEAMIIDRVLPEQKKEVWATIQQKNWVWLWQLRDETTLNMPQNKEEFWSLFSTLSESKEDVAVQFYWIMDNNMIVGLVSHSEIPKKIKSTQVRLWIFEKKILFKGLIPKILNEFCQFLSDNYRNRGCYIQFPRDAKKMRDLAKSAGFRDVHLAQNQEFSGHLIPNRIWMMKQFVPK